LNEVKVREIKWTSHLERSEIAPLSVNSLNASPPICVEGLHNKYFLVPYESK
jgi:hypothetical protein